MPTFTWTLPDPLDKTAKTRSIYITELQNAVNVRRVSIGLIPITFIDQSVGKEFLLTAIEELKTVTNDLAILYGYSTGVQDPALLGRPYVTITKKYDKEVCHYPIINDLRIVLEAMVVQEFIVWANINIALPYNHNKYIITKPYDSLVGAFEIIRSSPVVTYQVGFVGLLTDVTNIYTITTEGSYGTLRKIDSNSFATVDFRLGSSAWWPIVD